MIGLNADSAPSPLPVSNRAEVRANLRAALRESAKRLGPRVARHVLMARGRGGGRFSWYLYIPSQQRRKRKSRRPVIYSSSAFILPIIMFRFFHTTYSVECKAFLKLYGVQEAFDTIDCIRHVSTLCSVCRTHFGTTWGVECFRRRA